MVKLSNRQKRVKKRKRERKKKWEPRKRLGRGMLIGYAIALTIFASLMLAPNLGLTMYSTTGGGEFDFQLMGVGIKNPYDRAERVVVFSDDGGHAEIDGTRTTWRSDGTETIWNTFEENMDEDAMSMPYYLDNYITSSVGKTFGWVYAPPEKYNNWNNENNWLSATGCQIDPDAKNSGVPDLSISITGIYPSNSLGEKTDDYSHEVATRTLMHEGETRELEIHYGFVTLQVLFAITGDYGIEINNNKINAYVGEQVGAMEDSNFARNREWNTLGARLEFNAIFKLQINSLKFEDDWILNPTWWNLGNGILEIYKRGFGGIKYVGDGVEATEEYQGMVLGLEDWKDNTDLQITQGQTAVKYSEPEHAMDEKLHLTDDSGSTILDFKEQNPETVYFPIANAASLGLRYEEAWNKALGDTLDVQNLYWIQNIVVKFYTSVCMPLAGEGQDPFSAMFIKPPEPTPRVGLWSRIINWVSELLGVKPAVAQLIVIACIVVVSIIVILIILALVAPQVYPMIGKAIKGFFEWRAARRAARK